MTSQFMLSIELIALLEWLVEHERPRLKALIKRAVEQGFGHHLHLTATAAQSTDETADLQHTFVAFLNYVEQSLIEALHEIRPENALRDNLVHELNQMNIMDLDFNTTLAGLNDTERLIDAKMLRKKMTQSASKESTAASRTHAAHCPKAHENEPHTQENASLLTQNSEEIRRLLLSNILKRWKPAKGDTIN